MSYDRTSKEVERGKFGESLVAMLLKRCRCSIISSKDFVGPDGERAPRIENDNGFCTVLADFDISNPNGRRWVEVKTKDAPVMWGGWHELVHGFDLHYRDQYLRLQETTFTKVWIFVVELSNARILSVPLNRIIAPGMWNVGKPTAAFPGGSFNWRRKIMNTFAVEKDCTWIITDPDWDISAMPECFTESEEG